MPMTMEELDARLRTLEDIEEIRRLRMRYHYFINEGQFDKFRQLFTDDVYLDFGYVAQARGIDKADELFRNMPQNFDLIKQFIHNHLVDVNGDEATATAYLDARYAQDGDSVMVAAKFAEAYRRTPAGWRISELRVNIYFSTPLTVGWAGKQLNYVKPFK